MGCCRNFGVDDPKVNAMNPILSIATFCPRDTDWPGKPRFRNFGVADPEVNAERGSLPNLVIDNHELSRAWGSNFGVHDPEVSRASVQ